MVKEKAALRKELLARRRVASCINLEIDSLYKYEEYKKAEVVFCYVSAHGEVGTHKLIEQLLKEKTVVVPYCTDLSGNMICSKIKSPDDLKDGKFGIPEPKIPSPFPEERIDFVVVPGVAFDKAGFRLGYGKGYYDRFLRGISPFKLGVCQKEFYLDSLPHDEYDVKMDAVFTL